MKKYILISTSIIIYFITINTLISQTNKEDELFRTKIDTYLNTCASNGFSGTVLVSKKGKIILSKGYGWADSKNKIPNTTSTVFNIGSVTKQFTASAILKLVEQKKIKTSDKINLFFDQTPLDKKEITIHQLLTHTSGISSKTGGYRYNEASKEQFLNDFFKSKLQSKPGTKYQYANANYIMLTAILENVSKQTYNSYLKEFLFKPSQMNSTGYKSINFNTEKLAHGYYYSLKDEKWVDWGTTQQHLPNNNNHWYSIGKGDIHSTVEDLYKWHVSLKNNIVLSSETRSIQETAYVAENDKKTSHYGYGWAISKSERESKIVAHNGSNGLYFADFIRFTDEDITIIYLTNKFLGSESENIGRKIGKMYFNPKHKASPISKNIYELINQFIKINPITNASKLPAFLKKEIKNNFNNPSILNQIAYSKLKKEDKPNWALELFKLNVKLFPKDGNLWDSLGEAYSKYNQREEAKKSYTKALKLGNKESAKALNKLLEKNKLE